MEVIVFYQGEEADKKKNNKDVNLQLLGSKKNYGERMKN